MSFLKAKKSNSSWRTKSNYESETSYHIIQQTWLPLITKDPFSVTSDTGQLLNKSEQTISFHECWLESKNEEVVTTAEVDSALTSGTLFSLSLLPPKPTALKCQTVTARHWKRYLGSCYYHLLLLYFLGDKNCPETVNDI